MAPRAAKLSLLLGAAAAALLAGCSGPAGAGPAGVPRLEVHRGDFERWALLSGELEAGRAEVIAVPRTRAGQVQVRWMERHGALVRAGQRVVEFDNSALTAEIDDARLAVDQARLDLDRVAGEAAEKEAELSFAVDQRHLDLEQAELDAAVPEGLLPGQEAAERRLARRRAELALAKAREDLAAHRAASGAEIEIRRLALEKREREIATAEEGIAELVVTSPADGMFLAGEIPWLGRRIQEGDSVWPGFPVAEIPDLSSLRAVARLPDVDDGLLAAGMEGRCILDAHPAAPVPCQVSRVSPLAEEERPDSLRRSFRVWLELAAVDPERMRPGMSLRAEVLLRREAAVLLAPRAALRLEPDDATAWAGSGPVAVRLGPCNLQECVVLEGLSDGQVLVPAEGRR